MVVSLGSRSLLPAWRRAPQDAELLRPIRRVFHTLKGSGRLVGARTLGEFHSEVQKYVEVLWHLPVIAVV